MGRPGEHWHDFDKDKPPGSGYYMVEDRKGRVFRTWYESTVQGFNMIHQGVGYKITRWRRGEKGKDEL